jgi:hypothetical protein
MGTTNAKSQETAVSDEASATIDTLKEVEKEKLYAAENAYDEKVTVSSGGDASFETARGESGRKVAWVPGIILIGLGVIFLLNNVTGFQLHNWWALFILIPAIGSFGKAVDSFRSAGELNREGWGALTGGIILTLVASAFLFNLNWGLIWPAFLIIGGLGMLFGALRSW